MQGVKEPHQMKLEHGSMTKVPLSIFLLTTLTNSLPHVNKNNRCSIDISYQEQQRILCTGSCAMRTGRI